MNKHLVLLCLSLITSYSLCADCSSESSCEAFNKEGDQSHYVCAPNGGDPGTCDWVLSCNYAVKPTEDADSFSCSEQPVSDSQKFVCEENSDKTVSECIEVSICKSIKKSTGGSSDTYQCSEQAVSDPDNFVCVDETEEGKTNACKELALCETVKRPEEGDETVIDCSTYAISSAHSSTHTCVAEEDETADNACKKIPYCSEDIVLEEENQDCSKYPIKTQPADGTKVCTNSNGKCKEQFLCNSKTTLADGEDCSNFPVSQSNKNTHFCKENEGKCEEQPYTCDTIPKPKDGAEIDCSTLGDATHECIKDETESTNACKLVKKCLSVDLDDLTQEPECSYYPSSDTKKICQKDGETKCKEVYICEQAPTGAEGECSSFIAASSDHGCTDGITSKCKEEYYCSKVPKPQENSDSFVCKNYLLSAENKICIQNPESDEYACKEEFLCSHGQGQTDQECSKYPVAIGNEENYRCTLNSKTDSTCQEKELCEKVVLTEPNDELCNPYPVVKTKIGTHICVKNADTTEGASSCKEQPVSCEDVEKIGDTNIVCSDHPVKTENKDTHICIADESGDKPCKEEKLCEGYTEETIEAECRKYPVTPSNQGTKVCIKNPSNDAKGCIEKELCSTVAKGTGVDCSSYPLSDDKISTHICKAVEGKEKCNEVAMADIPCTSAEKGEDDTQCGKYKTSDSNHQCIKNTATTEGATPCIEKEKEITKCTDQKTGASDEICGALSVEKEGEQKCIKNPEGNDCNLLSYCQYAEGESDTACAKFALKDTNKVCKKKASENKCEEVEKTSEEGDDTTESTDTDDTTEASEKDDTTKTTDKDDTTKTTDKDDTTKETSKQDTTKETNKQDTTKEVVVNSDNVEGTDKTNTTTTKEKNNSGNFMNVGFGLLLLCTLL